MRTLLLSLPSAALLAACAGTPLNWPQSPPQALRRASSQCPCLYVASPIYKGYTDKPRITVYAQGASGDVPPIQEIIGSNTGLEYPIAVAVDQTKNIYVADDTAGTNHYGAITVYAAGATGNVAPTATITGSNTGLYAPQGIAINPVNGDIYVSNSARSASYGGSITIYEAGSNGNASPLGAIQGSATQLGNPYGLALDGSGNIYVAIAESNAVAVYAAGSTGNVVPTQTIQGNLTQLDLPSQVALDSSLNMLYVVNHGGQSVTVYAAGAQMGMFGSHPNNCG